MSIYRKSSRPKYAVQQINKKMISQNPHTGLYALMVLESVVKNCGSPIHEEIANKANCEAYAQLVQTTTHENVRNKMLELIQTWSYAFRTAYKYRGIKVEMFFTIIELVIAVMQFFFSFLCSHKFFFY